MWPKSLVHRSPKMLLRIKWAESFPIMFGILFFLFLSIVLWTILFSKIFPKELFGKPTKRFLGKYYTRPTQSLGEFKASIKRHLIHLDLWLWLWYGLLSVSYQNEWEPGSVILCSSLLSDNASTIMFCYEMICKRENSDLERETLHSEIDSYFCFCICSNFTAWFVCCFDVFYLCWHLWSNAWYTFVQAKSQSALQNLSNCSPSLM